MRPAVAASLALALVAAACGAKVGAKTDKVVKVPDATAPGVTMTLYDGYALVEDRREVTLEPGLREVRFEGVASLIDTTTVMVGSRTAPGGLSFVEQSFLPGQMATEELLWRAVGKRVRVTVQEGTEEGTIDGSLRTYSAEALVIEPTREGEPLRLIGRATVRSVEIDGVAVAGKPTLVWQVDVREGGKHLVAATYRALAIRWGARYSFVVDEDGDGTDVSAWITIANASGALWKEARIRLATPTPGVAGDAQRIAEPRVGGPARSRAGYPQPEPPPQPKPKTSEVHSYRLPSLETIHAGGSTELALVAPARAVPSRRVLVYDPVGTDGVWRGQQVATARVFALSGKTSVETYVELDNVAANGLGVPLPAGQARIFQRDQDGKLAWIGDDMLQHIGAGERIRLRLGGSPDVVGGRRQTEFHLDAKNKRMVEEIEISVENRAKSPRDVVVLERLARGDTWIISWASMDIEKDDTRTIRWKTTIPSGERQKFRYRVIYTW